MVLFNNASVYSVWQKDGCFTSTYMYIATTSEGMKELDIGIVECFPEFACVHLGFFFMMTIQKR